MTNALASLCLTAYLAGVLAGGGPARAGEPPATRVAKLRITILSTMVVDYVGDNEGVGEWGFAALVEADGRRILFDTGAHPDTVARNAAALKIDLADVTDVVLSHFHGDHTGGLVALRRTLRARNPHALERAHVGVGFFWPRREGNEVFRDADALAGAYREMGGRVVEHAGPDEIAPGLWVTGAIPRGTAERNFPRGVEVQRPDGRWVEDDVPDDLALVVETAAGPVVVTGCGHAGIVNTLAHVERSLDPRAVDAVVGGLHLFSARDEQVDWTAGELRRHGVRHLLGAHCTGIEALTRLRTGSGLDRSSALQAAVGTVYTTESGIDPGSLGLTR
jgi:7,8-dihydropterin-6-yl-methyl-4-(beta-D-ribofuranosyl)aminobenzene 5'-phosphate synthase